jgi:hypothetical protein
VTAAVVEALILELLQWLAKRERSYEEVMDAWRTSCPRLPIWEAVNDRGTRHQGGSGTGAVSSGLRHWGLPFFSSTNLLPANKKVSLTHLQFFLFEAFPMR